MEAEAADGPAGGVEAALSCFSFNQDCTSLAIGTKAGYKLFSLSSVEQLDQVHGSNEIPDVYIVERLFSSSLVVVVSHTKPRQMNVYHFKKGTEICNYSYSSNILSIRLNRQRLLVCLEESIYIHNIKDMKLLKTILDVPANPTGLCALSINHSNSYVAYPGSLTTGEIVLYDGHSLKTVCTIAAHEGTLAAITFNASGSKLASASEKGTVIRVFSVPEGQKLYEFRRGMKSRPEEPATWSGYMGKMFMAASTYLPAQVSDMMNQDRAFATGRLTFSGQKNICTLSTIQKLPRLLVASSDGHLYIYNLDPQDGGECVLIKTHRLLGSGTTEENKENDLRPSLPQSYAATVARPSASSASTVPDNIVPRKPEGQSEAVMMRRAPQKSGHPPSGGFGENQEGGRMACDGGRRVGGRNPRCPLLKPQDVARCSASPPQSRLPVGTGDAVYASCYWNYITAIMSMLTNHIGL
ncbi:WD repeat domain phosphoinositide-interacting protein 1 isoform X3 [Myotis lucifugus]|uniref:WD repeat domain phosphoinositide-interacting protein 1 isoform X3 n=1 Tax=Myotis lucifugus TaxID=59463 RepID=UPI000CCC0EF4|nr:WD repeat domain phosphoinositide-interacting protein 1 isoform X3 [Myotis lucifugus]